MGRFVVGKEKDLPPGLSRSVRVNGRRVALFHHQGRLYAADEACPHMGADLSNGELREGILRCAWHGWCFDLASGRGVTKAWARLRTHRLFLDGGDLVLELQDPPEPPAGPGEGGSSPEEEPR